MNAETAIAFAEDILERPWGIKGVGVCIPSVDLVVGRCREVFLATMLEGEGVECSAHQTLTLSPLLC